jgi:hypothetical protein
VLQEFKLEKLTVGEREVVCSPVIREFEFVFLTVGNPYRNGRCESISSSEAMIYKWTSLGLCLMIKKDNVSRPYTTSFPIYDPAEMSADGFVLLEMCSSKRSLKRRFVQETRPKCRALGKILIHVQTLDLGKGPVDKVLLFPNLNFSFSQRKSAPVEML